MKVLCMSADGSFLYTKTHLKGQPSSSPQHIMVVSYLSASLLPAAMAVGVNSTRPQTSPSAYTPLVDVC